MAPNVWGLLALVHPGHPVPTQKYEDLSRVASVTARTFCFIPFISWAVF